MKRFEFHVEDPKAVSDFIKEIQALFPNYDVNLNNVNDFSIMHEEQEACKNCKGLAQCKNHDCGHYTDYENNHLSFVIVNI
jgi:hypothetical protein